MSNATGLKWAAVVLAFGVAAAHAQDQQLAPAEIKAWTGKKVFGRSSNGAFVEYFPREDGTAAVSAGNGNDTGTWRLTDTGYCTTWKRIRDGKETCFTVVRRGTTMYVINPDGSVNTQLIRVTD